MKECWGLCIIACSIFCAQPDAKDEPVKSKPYYGKLIDVKKRNVRITAVPPIAAFNHLASKPPLHTIKETARPATAPYVQLMAESAATEPKPSPFLNIVVTQPEDAKK